VNRGHFANSVTKIDMETGETVAWLGDNFTHPSEAIFVPNPEARLGFNFHLTFISQSFSL
jgi:hypothetical protein